MFLHTVEAAKDVGGQIIVATDSDKLWGAVASPGVGWGIETLLRRPRLSEPGVSAVDVVLWVLDALTVPEDDEHAIGLLLPTSPLRTAATIRRCMELWERDPCASVATVREIHRDGMRYATSSNWLERLKPPRGVADPYETGWPPLPRCYVSTGGCQIASARTLRAQGRYWVPKTRPIVVDSIEGLDVDTESDWALADAWLRSGRARHTLDAA